MSPRGVAQGSDLEAPVAYVEAGVVPVDDAPADETSVKGRKGRASASKWALRLGIICLALCSWQLLSGRVLDSFLVSSPSEVTKQWWDWLTSGYLFGHSFITLKEALYGYVLGVIAGVLFGLALGVYRLIGLALDPVILALYALPKVALAPLLVVWFGTGMSMKVILTAVIVFFFVFQNAYAGVKDVDAELIDVAKVLGLRRRHLITKVVIPSAFSWIYVGMKSAVPHALIGAVVGEIIASNQGIGYVVSYQAAQYNIAGVFAALFTLVILSSALNLLIELATHRNVRWKEANVSRW